MTDAPRRITIGVALVGLLTSAVLIANIDDVPDDPARWCLAGAASAVVGVVVIYLLWWVNRRRGRPITPTQAALESALVGIVFAGAQILAVHASGLTLSRGVALTLVSVTISTTAFGLLAILIGQARRAEVDRLQALVTEGFALDDARLEASGIIRALTVALASDIDAALSPARISIESRLADQERLLAPERWADVAGELRVAAAATVRPLSRRLWTYAPAYMPRPGLRRIIRTIVTEQPFQPTVLILVYWATTLAGTASHLGWWAGMLAMALGTSMIAIILGGANLLMRRMPRHHALVFISATVALQAAGLLTFPIRATFDSTPYTWAEYVLSCIGGVVLILVTSGFGSLRTYREDLDRTLRSGLNEEFLTATAASGRVAQLARESARILHGSVQTRLIACAVAIEHASVTQDAEAFRRAMQEAYRALAVPALGEDDPRTLGEQVEQVVSLWRGLSSLHVMIDATLADIRGPVARDVARVTEESITNAITHGDASVIYIDIGRHEGVITIDVVDDGSGPTGDLPGLGSALLDSVCQQWELVALDSGARLSAVIALPTAGELHP